MDSLSSVILPPSNPLRFRRRQIFFSPRIFHNWSFYGPSSSKRFQHVYCEASDGSLDDDDDNGSEEVEIVLHLDGTIPGSSNEFVKRVSSRVYDIRRRLQQTFDSSSNDVSVGCQPIERRFKACICTYSPGKPVVHNENPKESLLKGSLGGCFLKEESPGLKLEIKLNSLGVGQSSKYLRRILGRACLYLKMRMKLQNTVTYCREEGGYWDSSFFNMAPVTPQFEASSVFDLCQKMSGLTVLFRKGRSPPLPQSPELNLRAGKQSLEDQEDLMRRSHNSIEKNV